MIIKNFSLNGRTTATNNKAVELYYFIIMSTTENRIVVLCSFCCVVCEKSNNFCTEAHDKSRECKTEKKTKYEMNREIIYCDMLIPENL